jgi:hypothetical protein
MPGQRRASGPAVPGGATVSPAGPYPKPTPPSASSSRSIADWYSGRQHGAAGSAGSPSPSVRRPAPAAKAATNSVSCRSARQRSIGVIKAAAAGDPEPAVRVPDGGESPAYDWPAWWEARGPSRGPVSGCVGSVPFSAAGGVQELLIPLPVQAAAADGDDEVGLHAGQVLGQRPPAPRAAAALQREHLRRAGR